MSTTPDSNMKSHDAVHDYGEHFCVLDMDNLFVTATLQDELLLMDAEPALTMFARECADFGLCLDPTRRWDSYSGGEQALLCCLLHFCLLPAQPCKLLFVHILEALSPRNRRALLEKFHTRPELVLHQLASNGPEALAHA